MNKVGLVAIARNEGIRLEQCLKSVINLMPTVGEHSETTVAVGEHSETTVGERSETTVGERSRTTVGERSRTIVYVDSGSTDDSVKFAKSLGVDVVELDLTIPFTAARARNTGFNFLKAKYPDLEFVQFIDGDCEVVTEWLEVALQEIQKDAKIAIVCGRRREKYPDATIYNKLCDIEWNTPIGETNACGGDALIRVSAFTEVNGFNPDLIAGEEPELCVRLREKGWKINRIDADMTIHDANMTKFSQWWKRMWRSGHAYAEGAWLHGNTSQRHWVKETRSIWFWGLFFPLLIALLLTPTQGLSLVLLALYPILTYRIYRYMKSRSFSSQDSALYALSCILGKVPQSQGQMQFLWHKLMGKQGQLVEYK